MVAGLTIDKKTFNLVSGNLFVLRHMDSSSADMAIKDLLSGMDTNKDKKLTKNELYQGILNCYSSNVTLGCKFKSLFSLQDSKYSEEAESIPENIEDKFKMLKIDLNQIKEFINNIDTESINLEDPIATITEFIGIDKNSLKSLSILSPYVGFEIDIEKLTISQIVELVDLFGELINCNGGEEFLNKVIDEITKFNNGKICENVMYLNILSTIYNANIDNDEIREFSSKLIDNYKEEKGAIKGFFMGILSGVTPGKLRIFKTPEPIKEYEKELFEKGDVEEVGHYMIARYGK